MSQEELGKKYHQLVLNEIDHLKRSEKAIVYKRVIGSRAQSQLAILCGQYGLRDNDLIDQLIDNEFTRYFIKMEETNEGKSLG